MRRGKARRGKARQGEAKQDKAGEAGPGRNLGVAEGQRASARHEYKGSIVFRDKALSTIV